MNETNTEHQDGIGRRNMLKATGSAAAFGLANASIVEAQPGEVVARTFVAKAEMELPDLPDLSQSGVYPIIHVDSPQDHLVHEGKLYLLESITESEVRTARRNQPIVRNRRFRPMANGLFDTTVQSVPTYLGWAMQRSYRLDIVDGYGAPPIALHPTNDGLKIDGPAVSGEVPNGTEQRFDLPAGNVELEIERPTDEEVDEPHIPERLRGRKIERWTETVTIEPELVVRNHGQLEVVDATDKVTISTE